MTGPMTPSSGFEPTYEGLKPASAFMDDWMLTGFEPTYEGLKLHKVGVLHWSGLVLSLPTRD